ncbi:hypothetical protein CLOSTASPAR_06570 [[Clostridium] asparagiforme DSM 15981]|uniref:Uncharacterized protein n=1 Tax=[Clostridium] asparagiforme DSM 15981 TaxID=518636 RepID=C0DBB4_9FIRM|nr:hypothetical protein CLOSTASPAR_06570 [[Clostridium] asparagiforme DSM 15981]
MIIVFGAKKPHNYGGVIVWRKMESTHSGSRKIHIHGKAWF